MNKSDDIVKRLSSLKGNELGQASPLETCSKKPQLGIHVPLSLGSGCHL